MNKNIENNYLTLKDMQAVCLQLLKEFDVLCKQNGLRYDLGGGTLLGAVRHQGFIPWDDDIDVNMPRPDYERMLKLQLDGKLNLENHRDVIMYKNYTFPRHYARYIRYDVKRHSEYMEDEDCPYIGIDIFPTDGLPAEDRQLRCQMKEIETWRRLLLISMSDPLSSRRRGLKKYVKRLARIIIRIYGPWNICKRLDRLCQTVDYNDAEYVGCAAGMAGVRERWLKSDMEAEKLWVFEGDKYPGYLNADTYLTNLYGNYMQLPPVDERVPHGDRGYYVTPEE